MFKNTMKSYLRTFSLSHKRFYSTLIIPEINNNLIHPSISNLITASSNFESENSLLLYGSSISDDLIKKSQNLKNLKKIFVYENSSIGNFSCEYLSHLISQIHKKYSFDNIISPSNNFGKNFLPYLGGLLDIQPISDVTKIHSKNVFARLFYAGNAVCKVESDQKPNLLSIRLTSFDKTPEETNTAEIVKLDSNILDFSSIRSSELKENITTKSDKPDLTAAKVVISGGRALKNAENFKILDDFSQCFDSAAIGASRAAVDAGFCASELQIGQTGKVVAPELYFAVGISGAIQHIAGMKDSKIIVAVNTDGDAPIFSVADYGLVGDLFKIVPELTEKLKKK